MMSQKLARHFLDDALATFRGYKSLAEGAFKQLADDEFFLTVDREANSIGVIIKHLAGNMRSRWTDFLTTDGEKPDRDRDSEFVLDGQTSRADVLGWWEDGWRVVFGAIEPLQ